MAIIEKKHSKVDCLSDIFLSVLYLLFVSMENNSIGIYLIVGLTIAIFIINIFHRGCGLHWGVFHSYMLLFALFSLLSSFWAINSEYAIEKGNTLIQLLIMCSLLYGSYYYADIQRLLKAMMWGGLLLGVYTLFFYGVDALEDTLQSESRLSSSFANINSIGMACCSSIIIALYLFKRKKNYIHLIFCLPSLLIVAGSGSRKALAMLILGILFVFLYQNREHKYQKKYLKIFGSIALLAVVLYIGIQSGIFAGSLSRMDGLIASFTGQGEADSSSILRSYYRMLGFSQLNETPIVGIGMGNARILALSMTGHDCYLHCNYAELAANGGFIGLILYYWIYVPIIKKEWKARTVDYCAPIILFLIMLQLLMDYGAVSYYSKQTYFLLMVVMLHIERIKRLKLAK